MNTENSPLSLREARIVLAESIASSAVDLLARAGALQVDRLKRAIEAQDRHRLAGAHVLGIRSRTNVTAELLAAAPALVAIGCFSVGTNQVDLPAARNLAIPVFNAPFSNTRSVAELTIGEIVMLLRRVLPRSASTHQGGWDKSTDGSFEVRGKTLGIIGYGNIGGQLSNLAEAMGMRVVFYDLSDKLRYGNTLPTENLEELLAVSDVVSLHVPETPATYKLLNADRIRLMKPGSYLINNSRGTVVDLDALSAAIRDNHLRGAAIDVFPSEPKSNKERFVSPLQGLDNVILTPHVGGSTEEAQDRIGSEVARKLIEYIETGSTIGAVNFPQVQVPSRAAWARFVHVHRNVPGVLGHINQTIAHESINITAQYLQTDGDLGYVVVEADADPDEANRILRRLGDIDGTIRARLIRAPTRAEFDA